ncbi:gibberellin 2-beta-dioxygenase 2-like [Carica papaya]|uniref:gibberellin 2-beta-dioxygenase 2-like n=1 Tax=Carica papaya TaxID=3649 RepID=UPI000B8CF134|nr:gibberellin 2-beta-dioxygenase 2-like [Carica papaya]
MVVVAPSPNIRSSEKTQALELPMVDLSLDRAESSKLIVKASQEYGFFKVINHGVAEDIVKKMEEESVNFFAKPLAEKQGGGPANPFGYGFKNIGFNGDMGEVEYLLLPANPLAIAQRSRTLSNDPPKFSSVVNSYIQAVTGVACEILDLMAEGLGIPQTSLFSDLIRAVDSDSVLRLNHYPPLLADDDTSSSPSALSKVGFGEHSDPQILTILRSNDVGGLQISLSDGVWVPVSPDPTAFYVNVGDLLQAMTNGRLVSVRHRAVVSSREKSRISMAYFGGPPLDTLIKAPPEMLTPQKPGLYKPFTWADYKKTSYSLRLGDTRLNLYRTT